tara:strand:+ start:1364 stop:1864 length:501 start_codon:yes stop_codon:yes gene_type:complete
MEFTFENIISIVLVLFTGLSAGLCFTWGNAITPGIGRLDDLGYLMAFQRMNSAILNPLFFVVFFGPFLLGVGNLYVFRNATGSLLWLFGVALALYFLGVVLVTLFGNVPLNEALDKADLSTATNEGLRTLRNAFEMKWNRFHLIRTLSATTSFLVLLISLLHTANK